MIETGFELHDSYTLQVVFKLTLENNRFYYFYYFMDTIRKSLFVCVFV